MSHSSSFSLLMPLVLVATLYFSYRHISNAKALLQDWAQANQLRILHARLRMFMPWRMYFTTSRYQIVYQVSVYDETTHRVRAAWVRLGMRFWGVMEGDAVDVQWEHPDEATPR
ncbi:MAG TPA: hypothetical protein VGN24_09790 [Rhodanobacter sp.]|nr:hypothetical protein [Rhodanobacter sp.]